MIYLALGAIVLAVLVWAGRRRAPFPAVRFAVWGMAAVAAAVSVFVGLRGQWLGASILGTLALYLVQAARAPKTATPALGGGEQMSLAEARSVLGVGPEATADDIKRAFNRLMMRAHPDLGGSEGLAARLNAARDRLTP